MGVSMNHVLIGDADNAYRNRIFGKRLNHNSSQTTKLTMLFHSDNSSGFFCRFPDGFSTYKMKLVSFLNPMPLKAVYAVFTISITHCFNLFFLPVLLHSEPLYFLPQLIKEPF